MATTRTGSLVPCRGPSPARFFLAKGRVVGVAGAAVAVAAAAVAAAAAAVEAEVVE